MGLPALAQLLADDDREANIRSDLDWVKAVQVAYTAGSLSLAMVELLVHTDPDLVPNDLAAHEIHIPETLSTRVIARS